MILCCVICCAIAISFLLIKDVVIVIVVVDIVLVYMDMVIYVDSINSSAMGGRATTITIVS